MWVDRYKAEFAKLRELDRGAEDAVGRDGRADDRLVPARQAAQVPAQPPEHGPGPDLPADAVVESTESLAAAPPVVLDELDVEPHRSAAVPLLRAASEQARAGLDGRDLSGADLTGARLQGERLVGASLRGALLLGADLRDADLDRADLTGADLRGADLRGARLSGALFLTRMQVAAARGDDRTSLPDLLERPDHWA